MTAALLLATLFTLIPEPPSLRQVLAATPRMRAGERGVATAVVIGRKNDELYILTADHAVDGPGTGDLAFDFFTDSRARKPGLTLTNAKSALRRPVADFALLTVAVKPGESVSILRLAPPSKSLKKFPFEGHSVGCSGGDPPTFERESLLSKRLAVRGADDVAFFWQAEKAQTRGRSGGPLLNDAGQVIGIAAAKSLGNGYYVHLSEIHAALKTDGFDWLWAPEGAKGK